MSKTRRRRPPASPLTRKYRHAAIVRAKELGPILAVRRPERRADGTPVAAPGQAYVMTTGTVYHPSWCAIVDAAWSRSRRVAVVAVSTTGDRTACKTCNDPAAIRRHP